jgi:hypothetical protein
VIKWLSNSKNNDWWTSSSSSLSTSKSWLKLSPPLVHSDKTGNTGRSSPLVVERLKDRTRALPLRLFNRSATLHKSIKTDVPILCSGTSSAVYTGDRRRTEILAATGRGRCGARCRTRCQVLLRMRQWQPKRDDSWWGLLAEGLDKRPGMGIRADVQEEWPVLSMSADRDSSESEPSLWQRWPRREG